MVGELRQTSHSGTWPGWPLLPPSRMPLNGVLRCYIDTLSWASIFDSQALTTARVNQQLPCRMDGFVDTKHFFIVFLSHSPTTVVIYMCKRWNPQNATKSFRQKTASEFSFLSGQIELHLSHVYCSFILFAHFLLHSHFTFIYISTIWFWHNAHHPFLVVQVCIRV
jgi:hypothetical protein